MIAVIDYGAGNTGSVLHALRRLGREALLTSNHTAIRLADRVILPGVGAAGPAMQRLREQGLDRLLPTLTQPVLGICLGLQLLCLHSEEGDTACLGLVDTLVRRFPAGAPVPHVGWNTLDGCSGALLEGLSGEGCDQYFVHSYYAQPCAATTSTCHYLLPFSATLQQDNFYATQFHPEKSGRAGERLLLNFLSI